MTEPQPPHTDARHRAGYREDCPACQSGLDAAWAEAEAALPSGVYIYGMYGLSHSPKMNQFHPHIWRVEAGNAKDRTQDMWATGETWEAALRALAARLTENHGEPGAERG